MKTTRPVPAAPAAGKYATVAYLARRILAAWLLAAALPAAAAEANEGPRETSAGETAETSAPPPPTLEELLAARDRAAELDGTFGEERRLAAMRPAALAYAARGGLARRAWEIARQLDRLAPELSRVWRFEALMLHRAGFVVRPPAVHASRQSFRVTADGLAAVSADRVLRIADRARVLAAPPRWRDFLVRAWSPAVPPPAVLWPRDAAERALWHGWTAEGWERGLALADEIFVSDLARLTATFEGLARWHVLHEAGMVTAPHLALGERVTAGGGTALAIGERRLRVAAPAAFNPAARLWRPAVEAAE